MKRTILICIAIILAIVSGCSKLPETAYYFTNIDSHWTRLVTTMPEDMLISTLQSCRYTAFDEYGGQ